MRKGRKQNFRLGGLQINLPEGSTVEGVIAFSIKELIASELETRSCTECKRLLWVDKSWVDSPKPVTCSSSPS